MLLNFNGHRIDVSKVSYISDIDYDVLHHVNTTVYFFRFVVDGCEVEIRDRGNKINIASLRDELIKRVETYSRV